MSKIDGTSAKRQTILRPLIVLTTTLLVFAGCATDPYQQIGNTWQKPAKKLGILYVPPPRALYVEVVNGVRRYADVEVSVGKSLLANVATSGLGGWAGAHLGQLAVPRGLVVTPDPIVFVASVALETAIEASRQAAARKKATPFLKILSSNPLPVGFADDIKQQMARNQNLGFPGYSFEELVSDRFDERDGSPYFDSLDVEQLLVIGAIASFSPKFETLETSVIYGVLEKADEEVVVRYQNSVLVQSIPRNGLDGSDTRNELADMVAHDKERKLKKFGEPTSRRDWRMARNRERVRESVIKESARKIMHLETNYDGFDDADEKGARWLVDEGRAMKEQLAGGYAEAARLVIADLSGLEIDANSSVAMPPGYRLEVIRLPALDTKTRQVYRLEQGQLISLDKRARMIPLGS